MRCPGCDFENAPGAKFCVECGESLNGRCPKCGLAKPANAKFCQECGSSFGAATEAKKTVGDGTTDIRISSQHPVGEIPEGERKTVTALFADIKGSMELIEDLDPEDARAIVDPALKLMMDAVHRYDGYVAQSTGDGIFALFGAPVAHEDHPQRALYAALRMQEDIKRLAEKLRADKGVNLQVRVGVNSGEVVVRTIHTGEAHTEYAPIGHSTSLASRLQALAAPGSIAISDAVRKLVEGYFALKPIGPARIKGVSEPVEVYEVTGLGPLRTRLQASVRRGLCKFVGREAELAHMKRALDSAKSGHGQIVAAIGEAGVGKSRLFYEFRAVGHSRCLVLEALSVSHGRASAYLPVIDLLKNYFDIIPDDDARRRREKIGGKILILDRALEDTLPYIFTLLEVVESNDLLTRMDPEIRRRRTLGAIKRLLLRESLNQPLIVIFEDLHWLDEGSRALLNLLADSIGTAHLLMLVNYRPEFTHNWGNKTYYTQLRLDPLSTESGEEMLKALLGDGHDLVPLKRVIIEKTDGNPFFMEEIVQGLFEQGALLRNGSIKLAKSLRTIQIPSTVQAVLASRIDRLPPEQKDLLQTLAVIGKEFPFRLVREVSGKADDELQRLLSDLQIAEFVYEQPAISDIAYVFKHALSQQVAYGSALLERRRVLHERIARFLEAQFPGTVETQPELIAHHYTEGGLGAQAIPYWQRAGERALQRSANAEAISHLTKGLELLPALAKPLEGRPKEPVEEAQRCTLLLSLGEAQRKAGQPLTAQETFLQAAEIEQLLGSTEFLVRAGVELARLTFTVGLPAAPAVRILEEALQRLGAEDSLLKAKTLASLARVLAATGAQQRAMVCAEKGLDIARRFDDPALVAANLDGMNFALAGPEYAKLRLANSTEMLQLAKAANNSDGILEDAYCDAHFWRVYSLLEMGDMPATDAEIDAYARLVEEHHEPFQVCVITAYRCMRALVQGRFEDSEHFAQQAFAVGQRMQTETAAGVFGLQMFALRREQGRLKEIEPAVKYFLQQHTAAAAWRPGLALIYSELGRTREAREEFEQLAWNNFADLPHDGLWMGCMTYLADVCTFLGDKTRAATLYKILLPFAGLNVVFGNAEGCYGALSRYLGALATTLELWAEAAQHFEDALAMNARMNARPWLAHTQEQYARMLLARRQSGDREKAAALLNAALATARELGMGGLEERATAGMAQMEPVPR
jgi:predicted ATPase/class 3 adenylate cyclase